MTSQEKLNLIISGFQDLQVEQMYKDNAIINITKWLEEEEYQDYVPQIDYLIEQGKWSLLLDAFYQVVPFGTGGRRGLVGIGPNRINIWTVQASAQGHSQYLLKEFGEEAKSRGIVISYDVRAFLDEETYDNGRLNPVKGLNGKTLAQKAAEVYAANGIKVHIFSDYAPTPELSFMIRHLHAIAGNMISASHNPPDHNGQKVFNDTGGQLVPPYDQALVDTIVNEVSELKRISYEEGVKNKLITEVAESDRKAYIEAAKQVSLNKNYRSAKILFSPFHGTSFLTIPKIFKELGFDIVMDKVSSIPDPKFSSIVFNIPNPEVKESFQNLIPVAEGIGADIILAADPDADRIGMMSKEKNSWQFYIGNEIAILLTDYVLSELKQSGRIAPTKLLVKTVVTSNLISVLAKQYGVQIRGDLLVGFKYIGEIMDDLEMASKISDFLLGMEESHGYTAGNYIREKDAAAAGILLSELASKLKNEGRTMQSYLNQIYEDNGYFLNYLTEIRLPGAEGMSLIAKIQSHLRQNRPMTIGDIKVENYVDRWEGEPFLSPTDQDSRNLLIINFQLNDEFHQLQAIIRPSGTEPKLKFYFEIGVKADPSKTLEQLKEIASGKLAVLEKALVKYCYKIIDIDFPDRGFLLFWQLPAQDKIKYFDVEPQIAELKSIPDLAQRKQKVDDLLKFLGSDPIAKVDKAFKVQYGQGILEYLDLISIQ